MSFNPNQALACLALTLALGLPGAAVAQQAPVIAPVAAEAAAKGTIIKGEVRGNGLVDHVVQAEAGQTLSVDLLSTNGGLSFTILHKGKEEALFVGETAGNVADLPVPASGDYVIRLGLAPAAAAQGEVAAYTLGIGLAGADFADSLAGGPDWWQVSGLSEGGALNVRSGPGTRFPVLGVTRNGEAAQNRGCRMSGPDRWCRVQVAQSGLQGWVAGRFLREGAAP